MADEVEKVILKSKTSKLSVDADNLFDIELSRNEKIFPVETIENKLNQYEQYVRENDASNLYRLIFTINPVCSNVLFNHITEVVENEGSANMRRFLNTPTIINNDYVNYKYGTPSAQLRRHELIQDTGFSHPKGGNLTYHCGMDIFNNHMFRNKEFTITNPLPQSSAILDPSKRKCFNTIYDYIRDYDGTIVTENFNSTSAMTPTHQYMIETCRTLSESIKDNLSESNGWVGFTNPTRMDITNVITQTASRQITKFTINKALNNKGACEFVDMYPDRTLFSMVPKLNPFLKREEYNWKYCLTYPAENYCDNQLLLLTGQTFQPVNGIFGNFVDERGLPILTINNLLMTEGIDYYLQTNIKHNLTDNSVIRLYIVVHQQIESEPIVHEVMTDIIVKSTGLNGYDNDYY